MKKVLSIILLLHFHWMDFSLQAQVKSPEDIRKLVAEYKDHIRGPYKDIRWFCKDGTIRQPKDPCPEPGGNQRARYRDEVEELAKTNHLFIGQILATTPNGSFWDMENYHSRIKQYHLEKYLRSIDDGWILRKAQYYRGAIQSEDESAWGAQFLEWLLKNDTIVESQFYLIRQSVKYLPHRSESTKSYNIRSVSKAISDAYPSFQDLRIKIHGQPEETDIVAVKEFYSKNKAELSADLQKNFETLISDLQSTFKPVDLNSLKVDIQKIPKDRPIRTNLNDFVNYYLNRDLNRGFTAITAEKLADLRQAIIVEKNEKTRLILLDLSLGLEQIFFMQSTRWQTQTAGDAAEKICYTGLAAMGCGYIETWEWEQVAGTLANFSSKQMPLGELIDMFNQANNLLQWGTGMVNAVYKDVVKLYGSFEPLAGGFLDDMVRSSVLLPLGNTLGKFGDFIAKQSNISNRVLDLTNPNNIRGLNQGIAMGELVVVENGDPEEVSKDKIYVFKNAATDLKPVAGILTVSEGNLVSHVQLLARNLGIPNATISSNQFNEFKKHQGKTIFYAVSDLGTVIIKPLSEMSGDEKQLFSTKARSDERIRVPTEKINIEKQSILDLREINASSSGITCGPKAANLGQLKSIFPDLVVDGIVLPFGIFRKHLDQKMPGKSGSYWQYLNTQFKEAEEIRKIRSEAASDSFILVKLNELREAIKIMPLTDEFLAALDQHFLSTFGKLPGQIPVFLRSDTNMEDLKDFTGAGLNLTKFNLVKKEDIIQGIKEVWASPYTERSFRWRQRYLLNPEHVYPSILIIPSVDVDYSGVLITKGIPTRDPDDITVAFSRGAGGAVDGQAAESYVLTHQNNNQLLAPAREPQYRRLPATGGTSTHYTTFEKRIVSEQDLQQLRHFTQIIKKEIPKTMQINHDAPLDVELGFKDHKIWLFQIRPFVENKNATNLAYLEKIAPVIDKKKLINMTTFLL